MIFIGQPGTGNSHLSVALGMKACEADYSMRFTTIQDLAATLRASMADHITEACIQEFVEPDLVILDEPGFTQLDPMLAAAFYRIVASRSEQASTIITSNKSFESWAEMFPDAVIASAILDRLVHHAHLVPIVGGVLSDKEHHGKTERRWFHSVGGQASRPLTGPLRRVTLHDHRGVT